jgi:hypothetical protein
VSRFGGRSSWGAIVALAVACGGQSRVEFEGDGSGGSGNSDSGGRSGTPSTGGSSIGGSSTGGVAGTSAAGTGGTGGTSEPPLACDEGDPVGLPPEMIADRLSRLFFEEPADEIVLQTARRLDLRTTGAVGCFARELLEDERADFGISHFFEGWLDLAKHSQPLQDPAYVPGFTKDLLARAKEASLWYATGGVRFGGTLEKLLGDSAMPLDSELAPFYGIDVDGIESFTTVDFGDERSGILTQLYFLMSRTTVAHGSPTQRGMALDEMLGCLHIEIPPVELASTVPAVFEGTTRAWYEATLAEQLCQQCHQSVTSLGYAFEHFDVLGRYRDEEAGEPVDATALFEAFGGVSLNGHVNAMSFLAASPVARRCFASHWLAYALASLSGERAYASGAMLDEQAVTHVVARASDSAGFLLREMFIAGVETAPFLAP